MHPWLQLVALVALGLGVFVVGRPHGFFGSDEGITREGSGIINDGAPFSSKRVIYEVFGSAGAVATIDYLDLSSNPQSLKQVPLPWTLALTTTSPATTPILLAQGDAEGWP